MQKNSQVVILSGVAASRSEAAAQSNDPYSQFKARVLRCLLWSDKSPDGMKSAEKRVGVLRLRHTIRKPIVWLRSG